MAEKYYLNNISGMTSLISAFILSDSAMLYLAIQYGYDRFKEDGQITSKYDNNQDTFCDWVIALNNG